MSISKNYYFHSLVCLIILLTISCSSEDERTTSPDISEVPRVGIDSLNLFLSPENSYLNRPDKLEMLPGGKLAILDTDQLKVLIYEQNGKRTAEFGRRGKGPGEFVAPRGLYVNGSTINILDVGLQRVNQFDLGGNFIRNYNIKRESSFFGFVATGDSMDYYTVANGYDGKLVGHHLADTDSTRYFGEAPVTNPPPVNDRETFHSAAVNGEVPDAIANDLIMEYSNGSLYVLIRAHNRLQKYSGEMLNWNVNIDLPVNEEIFKSFSESVQESSSGFGVLRYVADMAVTADNIYILWNGSETFPQQVVKISTEGEIQSIYQLPDKRNINYSSIAVDQNGKRLYLASSLAAEVYSTNFPE